MNATMTSPKEQCGSLANTGSSWASAESAASLLDKLDLKYPLFAEPQWRPSQGLDQGAYNKVGAVDRNLIL